MSSRGQSGHAKGFVAGQASFTGLQGAGSLVCNDCTAGERVGLLGDGLGLALAHPRPRVSLIPRGCAAPQIASGPPPIRIPSYKYASFDAPAESDLDSRFFPPAGVLFGKNGRFGSKRRKRRENEGESMLPLFAGRQRSPWMTTRSIDFVGDSWLGRALLPIFLIFRRRRKPRTNKRIFTGHWPRIENQEFPLPLGRVASICLHAAATNLPL
jgi:hypothetical protein